MAPILSEPAAHRVSPALLLLALLCFALPFAAVSCNTDSARPSVEEAVRALGPAGAGDMGSVDACLAGLGGRTVATYSGLSLAVGSDPATGGAAATACPRSIQAQAGLSASEANLGAQSLGAGALAAVVLALAFSLLRFRSRGLVVALLAGVAIVMLVLDQNRIQSLATTRVADVIRARIGAGNSVGSALANLAGVTVTTGVGFWLAVTLLLVTALYSSAATIVSGQSPPLPPPPAPAPLPPEGG